MPPMVLKVSTHRELFSHLVLSRKDSSSVMFQSSRPSGTVELQLLLYFSVVCLLEPGAQQDAVVMVTHGPKERRGGVCQVISQGEFCD